MCLWNGENNDFLQTFSLHPYFHRQVIKGAGAMPTCQGVWTSDMLGSPVDLWGPLRTFVESYLSRPCALVKKRSNMVKMYSQIQSDCVRPRFIISYFISIVWLWLYGSALGRCMALPFRQVLSPVSWHAEGYLDTLRLLLLKYNLDRTLGSGHLICKCFTSRHQNANNVPWLSKSASLFLVPSCIFFMWSASCSSCLP